MNPSLPFQQCYTTREGEHRRWDWLAQLESGCGLGWRLANHRIDYVSRRQELREGLILPGLVSVRGHAYTTCTCSLPAWGHRWRLVLPQAAVA